ncbi:hypothetical protein IQ22_03117 [Pseudomonas duriflava]|uniref:Uncharacterized protein n=1 Tax=Pseudomonas duriflava TaxID=459528 RepID=A0A562Q7K4_9PSED|nr:hypothetical protein [Pseudomonas duriflava]TWI52741.1 hypothetical protein IQ22_03117 [Pseudomonas duriflava]
MAHRPEVPQPDPIVSDNPADMPAAQEYEPRDLDGWLTSEPNGFQPTPNPHTADFS